MNNIQRTILESLHCICAALSDTPVERGTVNSFHKARLAGRAAAIENLLRDFDNAPGVVHVAQEASAADKAMWENQLGGEAKR